MKKYLLSLGTVALAIAPLATAISCGTKNEDIVSATAAETKTEMEKPAVQAKLKAAFNQLLASSLATKESVIVAIRSVLTGTQFLNVINAIEEVAYNNGKETITLTKVNATTKATLVAVEVSDITPAPATVASLIKLLKNTGKTALHTQLSELTAIKLASLTEVKNKVKASIGNNGYDTIINTNLKSVAYDSVAKTETITFTGDLTVVVEGITGKVASKTIQDLASAITAKTTTIQNAVNSIASKLAKDLTKEKLIGFLKTAVNDATYNNLIDAIATPSILGGTLTIPLGTGVNSKITGITLVRTTAELKTTMNLKEIKDAIRIKINANTATAMTDYTSGMFKSDVKNVITDIAYQAGIDQITIASTGSTKAYTLTATLKAGTTSPVVAAITVAIAGITLA